MTNVLVGKTDFTKLVFIPDSASTDGSGKTGLVAADLTVSYTRSETDNDVVVTDVTSSLNDLAALTTAHTDWGLKEVSSTLAPGLYRLDIADAVFAAGVFEAVVYVMVTTSAAAATPIVFNFTLLEALMDGADSVESGLTLRGFFRLGASVLFGKASGMAGTTGVFRDFADTKNRISVTQDADGNRSATGTRDQT